jgi:hypothetical protein
VDLVFQSVCEMAVAALLEESSHRQPEAKQLTIWPSDCYWVSERKNAVLKGAVNDRSCYNHVARYTDGFRNRHSNVSVHHVGTL